MSSTVSKAAVPVSARVPPPQRELAAEVLSLPVPGKAGAAGSLAAQSLSAAVETVKARPREFAALALLSIVVHGTLVKAVSERPAETKVIQPAPREIEIEFAKPPPPPPPLKVEPPKPLKQQVKPAPIRPARALATPPQQPPPPPNATPVSAPVAAAPPTANAVAVAPPPAPVEEPLSEPSAKAGYLRNPAPDYPAQAERQGWEGTALLKVHVLASGKPDSVEVLKTSGRKLLDQAAVTAVQRWSFVPAKRGQNPVDGWVTIPIEFKLGG